MTKYEKLESQYNLLETPEQQWAWVLAHKDEVILYVDSDLKKVFINFKKAVQWDYMEIGPDITVGLLPLLSVLGIEAEGV